MSERVDFYVQVRTQLVLKSELLRLIRETRKELPRLPKKPWR